MTAEEAIAAPLEALEAAIVKGGKESAAAILQSIVALGEGRPVEVYETMMDDGLKAIAEQIDTSLKPSGFNDASIAYFQSVAARAGEAEFDRLATAWFGEGGRA